MPPNTALRQRSAKKLSGAANPFNGLFEAP
jgi:hypothetical protein